MIEPLVREFIAAIGDNPNREGLVDTPRWVAKATKELFKGYNPEYKPNLTVFENGKDGIFYDEMIFDTGYFYSMCEHHLMSFFGDYYFGYIPDKKVIGLSKVARVVDYCASKLQIQERLGKEVIDFLWEALEPVGMGLVLKARHLCKEARGIKQKGGYMVTSELRGVFKDDHSCRQEFLSFVK